MSPGLPATNFEVKDKRGEVRPCSRKNVHQIKVVVYIKADIENASTDKSFGYGANSNNSLSVGVIWNTLIYSGSFMRNLVMKDRFVTFRCYHF